MSHFTRVSTRLCDTGLLVAALRAVGYPCVEVHDMPSTLYGYRGDPRPEHAEVVVRRQHIGPLSNDIGFRRGDDGTHEAVISAYDRDVHDERWLARLTRAYGHAAALRFAETHGYEIEADVVEEGGERRMVLRRYT